MRFAADWGASFNCILVYQVFDKEIRILNCFWVKRPDILDHVFRKAGEYYRYHKNKTVIMHYDPTGNNAKDNSTITSAQQAAKILTEFGFTTRLMTKGKAPNHEMKYLHAQKILLEEDPRLPHVRINGMLCKNLVTSMLLSAVIQGTRGERKDKRSEEDNDYPQEDATHLSDAFDIILNAESSLQPQYWAPSMRSS